MTTQTLILLGVLALIGIYLYQKFKPKTLSKVDRELIQAQVERTREELKRLREVKIKDTKAYEEALAEYNRRYHVTNGIDNKSGGTNGSGSAS